MSIISNIAAQGAAEHVLRLIEEEKNQHPESIPVLEELADEVRKEIIEPAKQGYY